MFIVLLAVQAAIQLHGVTMAEHISAQGALAAARYGAGPNDGTRAAEGAAGSVGARLARSPYVVATTQSVTVEVSIRVPRALPLFPDTISRTISMPKERFVLYGER